jgi:iron complex outermembrane receptor protein
MKTISQEIQLLGSNFGDRLDWIIGLYYLNEDGNQQYMGDLAGIGNLFTESSRSDTTNYAVYAEGTWNFTDMLSLTAGGRWSKDDKEYDLTCIGDAFLFGCTPASDGTNAISLDENWSNFSPKVSLNADINDNMLMYLSVANGFQAGGFQTLCFGNLQCAEQAYKPQEVWSYEYGIKSDWFDNKLRANFALFLAQYEDIQQTVPRLTVDPNTGIPVDPPQLSFPTDNVGDTDVWGLEMELLWTPIESLNLFANAGWMDADKVSFMSILGPVERDLPSNPNLTAQAGADYTINISSDLELFFGGDVNYSDEYFNDVNNAILISDYTRFNAFVGFGRSDNRWQVVGEWKNITNEEDNVSGLLFPGFTNMRTVLPPLEYMVTLKVNY